MIMFLGGKSPSEELKIISCSSLTPVKRIHIIINAISLLPKNIKVTWMHIGEGPLESQLKEYARNKLTKLK